MLSHFSLFFVFPVPSSEVSDPLLLSWLTPIPLLFPGFSLGIVQSSQELLLSFVAPCCLCSAGPGQAGAAVPRGPGGSGFHHPDCGMCPPRSRNFPTFTPLQPSETSSSSSLVLLNTSFSFCSPKMCFRPFYFPIIYLSVMLTHPSR